MPVDADISSLDFASLGGAGPVELFRAFKPIPATTCTSLWRDRVDARDLREFARHRALKHAPRHPHALCAAEDLGARFRGRSRATARPTRSAASWCGGLRISRHLQPEANKWLWPAGLAQHGDRGRQDREAISGSRPSEGDHHPRRPNIDPALIEEPLYRHPASALAAAVGKPDVVCLRAAGGVRGAEPGASARAEICWPRARVPSPGAPRCPRKSAFPFAPADGPSARSTARPPPRIRPPRLRGSARRAAGGRRRADGLGRPHPGMAPWRAARARHRRRRPRADCSRRRRCAIRLCHRHEIHWDCAA